MVVEDCGIKSVIGFGSTFISHKGDYKMNVLIACEESGIVREAFRAKGHNAWSCDLLPATDNSRYHLRGNVLNYLHSPVPRSVDASMYCNPWHLMIAFPPCTYLSVSGARWFKYRKREQKEALQFINDLMDAPIKKIAIENPIGVISTKIMKPAQIIQPWQFGHGETKATCLWLNNLPLLTPTNIVFGREARIHKMAPSKDRSRLRSITYQGIADAMAEQWG